MSAEGERVSTQTDQMRALVPAGALVIAVVALATSRWSPVDLGLAALAVAAFAAWAYLRLPLVVLTPTLVVAVAIAQRDGEVEPLLFEISLLALVVALWSRSLAEAIALGLLAVVAPVAAGVIQDPSEISVGVWIMGIVFPWVMGRALARQRDLSLELEASRQELADQALLAERRRIARDVHDFVGHGLAAVMLQVTSARHVLRRDLAAAEDALRSAEEVGRRSMQELRRTVALLRSADDTGVAPPVPSAADIPDLVEQARSGGLEVELRSDGDLSRLPPSVGVALYRISQEALANAARHAPKARTVLEIEVAGGRASLVAGTSGPTVERPSGEPERSRYGVVGMRERAKALGGELVAGPTPEGWRVSCQLPVETSRPTVP